MANYVYTHKDHGFRCFWQLSSNTENVKLISTLKQNKWKNGVQDRERQCKKTKKSYNLRKKLLAMGHQWHKNIQYHSGDNSIAGYLKNIYFIYVPLLLLSLLYPSFSRTCHLSTSSSWCVHLKVLGRIQRQVSNRLKIALMREEF